jgi:hypothetical protein
MATNPHVKIYVNGELLRKFGGTRSKVRETKLEYDRMNRAQFVEKHPHLKGFIDKKHCVIKTEYYSPNLTQPWHAKNINKHRA